MQMPGDLEKGGSGEVFRRCMNCLLDPWSTFSLVSTTDKWRGG